MATSITSAAKRPVQKAKARSNGWTKARRARFLGMLAETCNVRLSAVRAGSSCSGAYKLRRRDPAFAELWREALAMGYERLEAALLAHALEGVNAISVEEAAAEAGAELEAAAAAEKGAAQTGAAESAVAEAGGRARFSTSDVQLALQLLNRHRAQVDGKGMRSVPRGRRTAEEIDALLCRKLDALARKQRAGA